MNAFDEARIIAHTACLAIGSEPMNWVLKDVVSSLKEDGKPITKAWVLLGIDALEDAMAPDDMDEREALGLTRCCGQDRFLCTCDMVRPGLDEEIPF